MTDLSSLNADRLNEIRHLSAVSSNRGQKWLDDVRFLLAALDAAEQRVAEWKNACERAIANGADNVDRLQARAVQAEQELAAEKALRIEVAKLGADVTERAERAEQERDEAVNKYEASRTLRKVLQAKLDEALENLEGGAFTAKPSHVEAIKRAEAAEARATKATNALREVADAEDRGKGQLLALARRRLADLAAEEGT